MRALTRLGLMALLGLTLAGCVAHGGPRHAYWGGPAYHRGPVHVAPAWRPPVYYGPPRHLHHHHWRGHGAPHHHWDRGGRSWQHRSGGGWHHGPPRDRHWRH